MATKNKLISVIISTYNNPTWLNKVLHGFNYQTDKNFEIIIADDGSTESTAKLIDDFRKITSLNIVHVWHPDNGFQKCAILNQAIIASSGEYLIFTDGDCVPRRDFVSVHRNNAKPGFFLSGGYFKLPMNCSEAIDQAAIESGNAFDIGWLITHGYPPNGKKLRLTVSGVLAEFCNFIIPTAKTWNGHNSSGWKADIISVNGFDERMQYGGEDCEMGDRLKFNGIKVKRVRYTAVCIHLDHARGYVTDEMIKNNKKIRNATLDSKKTYTKHGIIK